MALSVPRLLPTKTYPFSDIRHTLAATGIQPGVLASGATTEFKVTQDTGANMNVKIAAGDSGAWVTGSDTTRQGAYHVYNDAIITTAVSAANATNPRIDQVVLRVYDSTVIGGGTDAATIEVIAGTATSGATLDNRTGAANLATIAAPKSLIRLADVLVPAASAAVTNANIRDRRPWALGAFNRIGRTANAAAGTNYTTVGTSLALIDSTNLQPRIECTGVPLRVTLGGFHSNSGANFNAYAVFLDGVAGESGATDVFSEAMPAASNRILSISRVLTPTAGSHLVGWAWRVTAGTGTLVAATTAPLEMTVEEITRQNTSNT